MTPRHDEIAQAVQSGDMAPEEALAAIQDMVGPELSPEEQAAQDEADAAQQRQDAEARQMRLQSLGLRLYNDATTQVQLRQMTEERWYQDVRQFNGQYDPNTFTSENQYGSRVFVPLTRRLVNLCEARLFDMLFPSEQRNFIIEPTPVPDIDQANALVDQLPGDHPVNMPDGSQAPAQSLQASVQAVMEEAKTRCDGMQREIDDQLAECRYTSQARDAIHDAVLYGTGVIKGPVPMVRTSKRWKMDPETGAHTLEMEQRPVPISTRVDLWNFFPDMAATSMQDCGIVFERHYLTKLQAAELKNMPGVDPDALRIILEGEPSAVVASYRERLRSINGASGAPDMRYEFWEYHGPITAQELMDCGCQDEAITDDPLQQYTGIVWFCKGTVIKASLNPLDTNDLPYRVFTWQKDESNIFGFGLPYEVRDQQVAANSSFRAMLDNMGLCVLPQVGFDASAIGPYNGNMGLEPGKFWQTLKPGVDISKALVFVDIESRMTELQALFGMNKQLIEEVGTLPAFMQGQDAPAKMQSATEASIAWTAANLWVRRCIRNWDDDITEPMITGYFDWNMQYSEKEEIKGDSRVRAMGISSLAELEGQAGRLQQLAKSAQELGIPLSSQYALLREQSRSLKLDPDLWLPTAQEVKKMKQQQAEQGPPPNIDAEKIAAQRESTKAKTDLGMATLQQRRESDQQRQRSDDARMNLEITKDAAAANMTHEQAQAKFGVEQQKAATELVDHREQRAHDAQALNAEMQVRVSTGAGV